MGEERGAVGVWHWLVTIGAIGLYFAGSAVRLPGVLDMTASPPSSMALQVWPERSQGLWLFQLGVTPIITALSIMEVARLAVPPLADWAAKGPRQALLYMRIVRALALTFAAYQALAIAASFENHQLVVDAGGWPFRLEVLAAFVGATAVLIWLAELVNANGVGDGLVVLYAAPIAAHLFSFVAIWWRLKGVADDYFPILLVALTVLSFAALVAVSRRGSRGGPLDLWSLVLGGLLLQWVGNLIMSPWILLVALVSDLSGGDLPPAWASALKMGSILVHVFVLTGLAAAVALRRAYIDQTPWTAVTWLLLIVEFVVWTGAWVIALLTPAMFGGDFGFRIILCVAAALSLLPPWRGGRALAPG